jgi:Ca2+-dependent lipid-binding protein
VCSLYILRGHRLMPKDDDGASDPYLKIKVGKKKYDTRSNYHKSTLDPDFFEP